MHRLPIAVLITSTILVPLLTGCVQRRMIVRSQPEGAFVTIGDQPVGRTPLSVPYTYAGTRDITLEKDGFKTVKVQQRFDPKWYSIPPFSLISENFAFREIRDERALDFSLTPKTSVDENQLLNRANDLRLNANRGTITNTFDN